MTRTGEIYPVRQMLAAAEPGILGLGVGAVWAGPLLDQPALAGRYRLLSYHRAGFTGSSRPAGPVTMSAHAAHCHLLMRELGITRAHIVGHSSSVSVALQLALDAPKAVHTLTLMEAARPAPPTDAEQRFGTEVAQAAVQRYRTGDPATRSPAHRDRPPGEAAGRYICRAGRI